ncbi:MAG: HAD-IIIC family phosphatase, partial [Gemmatimonadota bacterium]|nr:HAD-IIIC family phosphatase [Gemmatimonadota bacterium]
MNDARGVLISDFNTSNLAAILANADDEPKLEIIEAPFGQVDQLLLDRDNPVWEHDLDFALVWTRPEAMLPTVRDAWDYSIEDTSPLGPEVDAFAGRVASLTDRVNTVLVSTWVGARDARGLGPIDLTHPLGRRRLLLEANVRLVRALDSVAGAFVLDAEDWIHDASRDAFNDRLYYMAKIPFANPVFHRAAVDVKAVLRSVAGGSKKLIVLDLDNTLWGGVVGEDGRDNLTLGGHDPDGEAFVDFQRALKALTNRGILLAVASKNDEATALDAIDRHPEMVLSRDDLATWRIDWNDKAGNIAALVAELNLGLDSVVFIDDSPAERARVGEALPEVLVPEWPRSPSKYAG